MTFASLLANTWLAVNLFFQTGSVPIWVPLAIILLIILLLWWGLTRNRIPDENETSGEHETAEGQPEPVGEQVETEAEADAADKPVPPAEDEDPSPVPVEEEEPSPPEPDDLKIIEGIGPKIAGILAEAGITTYNQLAKATPEQLDKIVRENAGIKIADPTSWPGQAALAAADDWDGLEELQNKLVAGRHRD